MPKSVNRVTLLGHTGKDAEVKYAQSGTAIATCSLATSERFKDNSGEFQDRTEWHNLVAFGRTAEVFGEYVKKGRQIYVDGRIQTRSWDDTNTGEKKYRTEIVVNNLVLCGNGNGQHAAEEQGDGTELNTDPAMIGDTDVPF
jgi:single-strand DNA-binding protein